MHVCLWAPSGIAFIPRLKCCNQCQIRTYSAFSSREENNSLLLSKCSYADVLRTVNSILGSSICLRHKQQTSCLLLSIYLIRKNIWSRIYLVAYGYTQFLILIPVLRQMAEIRYCGYIILAEKQIYLCVSELCLIDFRFLHLIIFLQLLIFLFCVNTLFLFFENFFLKLYHPILTVLSLYLYSVCLLL